MGANEKLGAAFGYGHTRPVTTQNQDKDKKDQK